MLPSMFTRWRLTCSSNCCMQSAGWMPSPSAVFQKSKVPSTSYYQNLHYVIQQRHESKKIWGFWHSSLKRLKNECLYLIRHIISGTKAFTIDSHLHSSHKQASWSCFTWDVFHLYNCASPLFLKILLFLWHMYMLHQKICHRYMVVW